MARKTSRRVRRNGRHADGNVTRTEFNELADLIDKLSHSLDLQFTRTAQIQAELDEMRRSWDKLQALQSRGRRR